MGLTLTRNRRERIRVTLPDGRHLWITIADVDRGKVKLAFDGDRDIRIDREEYLLAQARGHAAGTAGADGE
jgi:sRNA-binding carbon storage regulator CsrA